MSTIFISHSSKDNEIAKELERRLAEQNHASVFLDLDPEKGIVAGQSWERTLYRKLRACRAVIVLCTDNYLSSHWCFAEIALARMEGKHIIALQVDPLSPDAKLPSILTEKQFIDLRKKKKDKKKEGEGYRRLWRGLKEMDLLGVSNEWDPKQSPYLGLSAYQERHASLFFGRDDETRVGLELLDRGAPGLIMVLGASGSGKSSLVRAGMVPRLRRDKDRWLVVGPFRPRRNPFAELAEALVQAFESYAPDEARREETGRLISALRTAGSPSAAESTAGHGDQARGPDQRLTRLMQQLEELRQSPPESGGSPLLKFLDWSLDDLRRICGEQPLAQSAAAPQADALALVEIADHLRRASSHREARVLLVIDQFEELLGHEDAADDANRFLDLVRGALEAEHSPLMALGTMRSDFLGLFQRNRALLGVDFESLSVGPMSVDGMRRVIEEPAKLGALELERGLADSLLEDTETPDALPLLSFTLSVLWKGRQNGTLTVRQYQELEGLHGAVAREAEAVLDSARRQGQEDDVRRAFLQMARLTEDGSYARLPVSWDREEIRKVQPILEDFEKRRLLVTRMEKGEERTVEVAHEALFRSWAPLKTWLDDHRGELLLEAQLRRDAQAWEENNCAKDNLWRGGRLQQAAELMRKGELGGAGAERSPEEKFIRAGVRRRRIQLGTLAGITACVFAVLTGFLWYAVHQKERATAQRNTALTLQSNFLADASEQQLRNGDAVTAALLALEGLQDPSATDETQQIRPYVPEAFASLGAAWRGRRERVILAGHEGLVMSAAFDPSGTHVVTASIDQTARVWDVATGKVIHTLTGHAGMVSSAAFGPDGSRIVTASEDETARVWDATTGNVIHTLTGHGAWVGGAAFSPDGTHIVTSTETAAWLWDATTGKLIRTLESHAGGLFSAAFSRPDGDHIITTHMDKTAQLWDAATGKNIRALEGHKDLVYDATFSQDGTLIVTASRDQTARIWDAETGALSSTLSGHDGPVRSAVFSRDGTRILTASPDATVRFWDPLTGEAEILKGHAAEVYSAAFSLEGTLIVTASRDNTARIWDVAPAEAIDTLAGHGGPVYAAAFNSDGTRIVTACEDNTARVWDPATVKVIQALTGHGERVTNAAFSPDGARIITSSYDKTARIWSTATGKEIHNLVHDDWVTNAAFSRDGTRIVTASRDCVARLWNAATGEEMSTLNGHEFPVQSVTFSPNGSPGEARIVTASKDKTARIWDATGKPIRTLTGHEHYVFHADFSPDGAHIVTASQDKTARIWDAMTGQMIRTLTGHKDTVWMAAFSPDGNRIVTASKDKTARVWNVSTGEVTKVLHGHSAEVFSAAFSTDGTRILTAARDKTARLWHAAVLERQELIHQTKAGIPRCLTPKQRKQFFLSLEPPYWCVEMDKWPYQTNEWKQWLANRKAGIEVEMPSTGDPPH